MMSSRLISDGGLCATDAGFDLDIRLPWYRSLPLSTYRGLSLSIDGRMIDQERIGFELNGEILPLDALPDRADDWWFILDSAILHVADALLNADQPIEVDLTLSMEIPYFPGFRQITQCSKTMVPA